MWFSIDVLRHCFVNLALSLVIRQRGLLVLVLLGVMGSQGSDFQEFMQVATASFEVADQMCGDQRVDLKVSHPIDFLGRQAMHIDEMRLQCTANLLAVALISANIGNSTVRALTRGNQRTCSA